MRISPKNCIFEVTTSGLLPLNFIKEYVWSRYASLKGLTQPFLEFVIKPK